MDRIFYYYKKVYPPYSDSFPPGKKLLSQRRHGSFYGVVEFFFTCHKSFLRLFVIIRADIFPFLHKNIYTPTIHHPSRCYFFYFLW